MSQVISETLLNAKGLSAITVHVQTKRDNVVTEWPHCLPTFFLMLPCLK